MSDYSRPPISIARSLMKDPKHPTSAELQGLFTGELVDARITNDSDRYLNAIRHTEFPLIALKDPMSSFLLYVGFQNKLAVSISCYSREVRSPAGLVGVLSSELFGPLSEDSYLLRLGDLFPEKYEKTFGGDQVRFQGSPITEIVTIIRDTTEFADREYLLRGVSDNLLNPQTTNLYAEFNSGDAFSHQNYDGLDTFFWTRGKRPSDF